jgi:hypothetical protein
MQNAGTQQNSGRPTSKEHRAPQDEQMGTNDTQSEFSVHEARQAAAKEENEQRQQQQQQDAKTDSQEERMSAQARDTQSEFSVGQRLREDSQGNQGK